METTSAQPVPAATRYPGVGPRAVATLVDAFVGLIVFGIPLLYLAGEKTTVSGSGGTQTTYSTSDPKVYGMWLLLALIYYVLFEVWLGATPGKLLLGLRVRARDGSTVTVRASAVRNLLRLVDAFPYAIPYLVGALAVWSDGVLEEDGTTSRRCRIGDRVAGTIVTYR